MNCHLKGMVILLTLLILASQATISGVDPNFITYQGRLTDAGGTPLDGTYSIAFSLWDDSTSGTQMWAETLSVEVTDGLFSVNLGWINELTVDICGAVDPWFIPFLQIEVMGEAVGSRTPLGRSMSSFLTQRVRGDITTAPGEVTVSDNAKISSSPTSAEVMLKSGNGDEAIEVTIDNTEGASISMIGPAGDTAAQYGPDRMFMVQLQPEPPLPPLFGRMGPEGLVFGIDPIFDKRMAEVCNSGIIFTDSATGDTSAQYGPGGMLMVQLQPEPPLPPLYGRMGPEGLVFGIDPLFNTQLSDFNQDGIILTDTVGDTTLSAVNNEIKLFDWSQRSVADFVRLEPGIIAMGKFDGTEDINALFDFNSLELLSSSESPASQEFGRFDPSGIVFGIDPLFDKRMAEVCNKGIMFTDTATGDTSAQYGPGGMLMVQLQPEPPLPPLFGRMGPEGLVFGVDPLFDKIMAEVCNSGFILTDSGSGDTAAQYGPGELVMVQLQPEPPSPSEVTRLEPGGVVFGIDPSFSTSIAEFGIEGVTILDTFDLNSVRIVANTSEVTHGEVVNEAVLGGDGMILRKGGTTGFGFLTKYTADSLLFITTSTSGDDTTVSLMDGHLSLDLSVHFLNAAGPTTTIACGDRYKDNSIVAWARVSSSASSITEFGVTSVTKTSTGYYTIVIDANMTSGTSLIPVVVPEVDSQPTGASSVRLASVNQTSSVYTFEVFINDGYYTPVDNDFVFMVTGR